MEKIGLLIDSTSKTRDDLRDYNFIKVAQLKVTVDDKTYDECELTKAEMIGYITDNKKLLTSQPSPAEFLDTFRQFYDEGYTHIFGVVLSSKISGTYQSALIAKSMIDFDLEVDIHSPDVASYGVSLGVQKLAEMIKNGKSYKEVENRYYVLFNKPLVKFTLGDLMNLFRGGRLSRVQAFLGKVMRIKPIIKMIEGKLDLVKKERTNLACINNFMAEIDEYVNSYKKVYLDIINIDMDDAVNKLLKMVKEKYKEVEIHLTDYLSPVFYSHLGKKGFGIGIVAE